MVQRVEEATDVGVEHPVHLPRQEADRERIQRLMRATPWSEPIREPEKLHLVRCVEHLDDGTLNQLVFQRGHAQRAELPLRLRDVGAAYWAGSARSPLQPCRQVLEVGLQVLPIVLPRLPVDARRRRPLQREVGGAQPGHGIHVVEQRGEPLGPVSRCDLPYPLERAGHAGPTLRSGVVRRGGFPLGRPLSSPVSAAGRPALFDRFLGRMGRSDFPGSCIIGVRPWTDRHGLRVVGA